MFEAPPERPLSLGDIVGLSFKLFRERFRFFFAVFIWPSLICSLAILGMKWCFVLFTEVKTYDIGLFMTYLSGCAVCLIVLILAQWQMMLRSLSIVRMILLAPLTMKDARTYSSRRMWATLLVYNLGIFAPFLVVVFWGVIAIGVLLLNAHKAISGLLCGVFLGVDGLLMTITTCWAVLFTSVAFCVLAAENTSIGGIFQRTSRLSFPYIWRGGSFVCLLALSLLVVAISLELPVIILSTLDSMHRGGQQLTYRLPVYLEIMAVISDTLVNMILLSVAVIADALYYNDLRLRLEGLDILKQLERMSPGQLSG